jgi:tetratricopeptide (TPR) repeat protein
MEDQMMVMQFPPTKSKEFFVGRQKEITAFENILNGSSPCWVVHIPAPGGYGKTKLLERYIRQAKEKPRTLVTTDLIDFYKTGNQTVFGLLQDVAQQLGKEHFPNFIVELGHFRELLSTELEPNQRQDAFNTVTELFLKDYENLLVAGWKIVLLFDTAEEIRGNESYVLSKLIPAINQIEYKLVQDRANDPRVDTLPHYQTTLVIAGRRALDFPEDLLPYVYKVKLDSLMYEEMMEFFKVGCQESLLSSEQQARQLYDRTGGNPLFIALSFDWLCNEVGTMAELLTLNEPFGQQLVSWVERLNSPEKETILYLALAWRRMENGLLAYLLKKSEDQTEDITTQMERFSFVKYRAADDPFPNTFQLHDEMRVLVNEYVWPREGEGTRREILKQVVQWYQQRIGDENVLVGQDLPPTEEMKALVAEWLFYECLLDLNQAFEIHEKLFRIASHHVDLDYCELLNQEIERFLDLLTPDQNDKLRFRQALILFRQELYPDADELWSSLLRRPDLEKKLRATILMLLVELKGYTGEPDVAIGYAEKAKLLYDELIENETETEHKTLYERELSQLYNNWGYVHRVKGNFATALEYYDKALVSGKGTAKNLARTLNNKGYIYSLMGDDTKARTLVGRALQLRKTLNIAYELGLGYNTMGMLMEESGRIDQAAELYDRALLSFEDGRSQRGMAMVQLNLGHLRRLSNLYEEALDYLRKSERIFRQKNDKDFLLRVINEIGCVYRQRGKGEDFKNAESYLLQSLAMAEEIGRPSDIADNKEDLSILYRRMSLETRRLGHLDKAEDYSQKSRKLSEDVQEIAKQHQLTYLAAKSERTLGDLNYVNGDYEEAFDQYLKSCLKMSQAVREGKRAKVQLERRFQEVVDRLQEQLQNLPSVEETQKHAQKLADKIQSLGEEEQKELSLVQQYLDESINLATSAYMDTIH